MPGICSYLAVSWVVTLQLLVELQEAHAAIHTDSIRKFHPKISEIEFLKFYQLGHTQLFCELELAYW